METIKIVLGGIALKLVCIGASYKFVKNVVCDLILTGEFGNSEVVVVDLFSEPLDIVVNACKAIAAQRGSGIKVWGTLDREEALKAADFVLVAISVGGFDIWEKDIEICKKYGIYHVVGDTIGPAAMVRAFRTIPVMLDIARDVEKICPHAWIINVSNPMTTLVKAVSQYTKAKILGLCHGSYEIKERIAAAYGVDISEVSFKSAGINHLTFATDILVQGKNVTGTMCRDAENGKDNENLHLWELGREMLKLTGYLPLIGDKHLAEFFPYYLTNPCNNGKIYGDGPIDFEKRIAHRDYLEKVHKEFAEGSRRLEEPYMYSGENVHGIILSLYYGREDVHIVNIPNKSYCPGLKEDSVVEVPARVFKDGLQGVRIEEGIFAPHILSVLYNLNVIYDYTAEAAVTGDRVKARQALSLDPMVRSSDIIHVIPGMFEELLDANRKYLKAFSC